MRIHGYCGVALFVAVMSGCASAGDVCTTEDCIVPEPNNSATSKSVDCTPDANRPDNAISINTVVLVDFVPGVGWEEPAVCEWKCPLDHAVEGNACIHSKTVACSNTPPANSTSNPDATVTIEYKNGAWETPATCPWACDAAYQDNDNSGDCQLRCTADTCGASGVCDDSLGEAACTFVNCVAAAESGAADGPTIVDPDEGGPLPAREAYCVGGWTYEDIGFGRHDREFVPAYQNWSALSFAELQDPDIQQAFLWGYNKQGGMENLGDWETPLNCCFTSWDTTPQVLGLSSKPLLPGFAGTLACGPYPEATYTLFHEPDINFVPPLQANFFDGLQVSSACEASTTNGNPTWFAKRYTGLGSCKAIRDAGLSIGSGVYLIDPEGVGPQGAKEVVCDMANGDTIEAVGVGKYDINYPSFEGMTIADFGNEAVQLAFAWYYGRNGGVQNIAPDARPNNCCMKVHNGATTSYLMFKTGAPGEHVDQGRVIPTFNNDPNHCGVHDQSQPFLQLRLSQRTTEGEELTSLVIQESWRDLLNGGVFSAATHDTTCKAATATQNPGLYLLRHQ